MGNCVSCTDRASSEQVELRVKEEDRRNSELQVPSTFNSTFNKMRTDYSTNGGLDNVTVSNGSSSNHHNLNSSDLPSSQKSEKKNTFYSRIPPLGVGRVGSTDKDKKFSQAQLNASITDNNNAYSGDKISALFEHYKDPHSDSILAEGIERLCRDLELKPEDFRVLILAWKCEAEQMCRFTRAEFFQGMRSLKTDTIEGIRTQISDISSQMKIFDKNFRDLYRFAFKFALDSEVGQRVLDVSMAVSLWRVVFWSREPPILERWLRFLESEYPKKISCDTWNMFLLFVETVGSDLTTYDDTEAWPSLFDDFVEYENDQLNQNVTNVGIENSSSIILSKDQLNSTQFIEMESQKQPLDDCSRIQQQQ